MSTPSRVTATVQRVYPTHCFAQDDWGVEYFVHQKNVSRIGQRGWEYIAAAADDYRVEIEGTPVRESATRWCLLEVAVL